MWTKEELSALQRRELQALAKEHGIQANSKSTEIIDELLAWADANALHVEIPTAEEEAGDAPSDAEGSGAENDESQGGEVSDEGFHIPEPWVAQDEKRNKLWARVEVLLREGRDVNEFLTDTVAPLHMAATFADWEVVRALLAAGATVDTLCRDGSGMTSLHLAVRSGGFVAVWLLIDAGADVNLPNASGETPIVMAARSKHSWIVALLLAAGAHFDRLIEEGLLTAGEAVTSGNVAALKVLAENGNLGPRENIIPRTVEGYPGYYNVSDETRAVFCPIESAIMGNSVEMVSVLVQGGMDVEYQYISNALDKRSLSVETLKYLFKTYDFSKDAKSQFLRSVIESVRYRPGVKLEGDIIETLLEAGADANSAPEGLLFAINEGSIEIVRMLIAAGATVNLQFEYYGNKKGEAVYIAASKGFSEIVELLVAEGAEPGHALFGAAEGGYTNLVKSLVAKKAPLDWQKDGQSHLAIAAANGHWDVVQYLLELSTKDVPLAAPLFLATQNNHSEIVRLLIERNADVNTLASTSEIPGITCVGINVRCTALYIAVAQGHTEVVKTLLEHGADVNIEANLGAERGGRVPLDVTNDPKMLKLLTGEDDHPQARAQSPVPAMVCIRLEPCLGETMSRLCKRSGVRGLYHLSSERYYIQIVKPTDVAAASELALLRNGKWTVGAADVRSAIGLAKVGLVTVAPRELPEGDEVYLQCSSMDDVPNMVFTGHSAIMVQVEATLQWRPHAEEQVQKPAKRQSPSTAVLSAFIAKLARHEIALVEEIEDYLYYHVLVADHVKYFKLVGPPVPPTLIAPALEHPLRIPRILHALFEVGQMWTGPDQCNVGICMPQSWDSHDDDHASPCYGEDFFYAYDSNEDEEYEEEEGSEYWKYAVKKPVYRPDPYVRPDDGSLFNRGRGWFEFEPVRAFESDDYGEYFSLHVCIGDNICNGDVRVFKSFNGDGECFEKYLGHIEFIVKDLFRRVKSIATQQTLAEQFEQSYPPFLVKYFENQIEMVFMRPLRSGASKGRQCSQYSPWMDGVPWLGNGFNLYEIDRFYAFYDWNSTTCSPGYPEKPTRRLFDWESSVLYGKS